MRSLTLDELEVKIERMDIDELEEFCMTSGIFVLKRCSSFAGPEKIMELIKRSISKNHIYIFNVLMDDISDGYCKNDNIYLYEEDRIFEFENTIYVNKDIALEMKRMSIEGLTHKYKSLHESVMGHMTCKDLSYLGRIKPYDDMIAIQKVHKDILSSPETNPDFKEYVQTSGLITNGYWLNV